ncbi:mechanosensitive ion channel protein MscL [Salinibacter sp. 10B]|uniref:large conductance mechanosensitive channel protein MscL n=1 Tax=Salinibacter sp. 10B TaxID=1923971 RepID=UPI000CF5491E|nr:large conductance mechanosensitive channel protein MscL [Salinibacter sp. 10B]PQJ35155.1 mechanosensitive ion channel protein MscL [Salinibacter sp. 10B]
MLDEYKTFAIRGNVVDMAVGIIIGAAFNGVVQSLVKDVLTPPLGLLMGDVDFTNLFLVLKDGTTPGPYATLEAARSAGAVTLNMGVFLNSLVSFLIVSFAVFLLVRYINRLRMPDVAPEPAAPTVKKCPYCVSDVALTATRCPHCTSQIPEEEGAADTTAAASEK